MSFKYYPKEFEVTFEENVMRIFVKLFIFGGLIISLSSCNSTVAENAVSAPPEGSCVLAVAPTFMTVQPIFLSSCDSCHSHSHSFSNYATAAQNGNGIYTYVNNGSMPQGMTLNQADKDAILQWVACGAKN